jgi:hypothetical protein
VKLQSRDSLAILGSHSSSADDLDGSKARAMTTSHVVVKVVNGGVEIDVSVLTIHIVRARARVILDPYTEVLHICGLLLSNLFLMPNSV